jgi:hypothetical protein
VLILYKNWNRFDYQISFQKFHSTSCSQFLPAAGAPQQLFRLIKHAQNEPVNISLATPAVSAFESSSPSIDLAQELQ